MLNRKWIVLGLAVLAGCGQPDPPPGPQKTAGQAVDKEPKADTKTSTQPSSPSPAATRTDTAEAGKDDQPSSASTSDPVKPDQQAPPPGDQLRSRAADLASQDLLTRQEATASFDQLGEQAIEQLVPLMTDGQVEVRRGAAFYLLGRFDADNPMLVQAFLASLDDEDPTLRQIGLQTVQRFPDDAARAALPKLARLLDANVGSMNNRRSVANLLAKLRTEVEVVMPALSKAALEDPSPQVRSACIVAIRRAGRAEQALPVFERSLLEDKDPAVRRATAIQLRQVGVAAAPLAPTLAKALADDDEKVRTTAAESLIQIGAVAVEPVAEQLQSPSTTARLQALYVLGKLGPTASPVADLVRQCQQDQDPQVRRLAELVLKRLKPAEP